eukprot:TRINITY_DN16859_c0_g1_i1.p1 TRINITY_DN16859_c0_g1~~TRINITY_DN16859_c0_g1_i1.p1  ORF type:complete len:206 (+),score=43.64 TRINITY_DN16859_c0_g1_i1:324-941(+)
MLERTVITSSLSKTYSVTGWRVGWAISTVDIITAIKNIHIKLTDSAPAPFQEAAVIALQSAPEYFTSLKAEYNEKKEFMVNFLRQAGFKVQFEPQGAVFVFAELPESCKLNDVEYVTELIKVAGIAAVPGCGFFHTNESKHQPPHNSMDAFCDRTSKKFLLSDNSYAENKYDKRYIRFAYCKSKETLINAAEKLYKYSASIMQRN